MSKREPHRRKRRSPQKPGFPLGWIVLLLVVSMVAVVLIVWPYPLRLLFQKPVRIPNDLLLEDVQSQLYLDLTEDARTVREGAAPVLDRLLMQYDDFMTMQLALNGIEVRPGQFPDLEQLESAVTDCIRILGFDERELPRPRTYVVGEEGLNAYTTNFVEPVIVLHSELLRRNPTPAEMRFIIGHEMGHILCEHVDLQTLFQMILKASELLGPLALILEAPYYEWAHETERICDRVGLICCQDLEVAELTLIRVMSGLDCRTVGQLDADVFLQQGEGLDLSIPSEIAVGIRHKLQTHPFLRERVVALRAYAASEKYKHLWEN